MKIKFTTLLFSVFVVFTLTVQAQSFPEVEITDFKIYNVSQKVGLKGSVLTKPLNETTEIKLNYKQSHFSFQFALKNQANQKSIQFSYMLEGFHNRWVNVGENNIAIFTHMPPGEYRFKVKASTSQEDWGKEFTSIKLIIITPFWQTGIFKTLLAGTMIFMIFLFVRHRQKKSNERNEQKLLLKDLALKKKEAERKLFEAELNSLRSQMNPHFIFNALSSIQGLVNNGDSENANIYLSKFSDLLRTVLVNSKHRFIPISDELDALRLYLELEKLRMDFSYELVIAPNIDIYTTEIPGMLLQPITENAIFHGLAYIPTEKKLKITLTKEGERLMCTIEDNGIGVNKSKLIGTKKASKKSGLGISLTRERLKVLSQEYDLACFFEIKDKSDLTENDNGTIVHFSIPLES